MDRVKKANEMVAEMMELESKFIACSGCRQVYPVGRVVKVGARNFCYGCFSVAEATGLIAGDEAA